MAHRIVVMGGNGLLGSAICRAAALAGVEVTSISRRGLPPSNESWTRNVEWAKGDALDPTTYASLLRGASGVIHTVGTLMENDKYKQLIRSNGNFATYNGATYEVINRDTALAVAKTVQDEGVGMMLYISAAFLPPGVDRRYLSTKREAEESILAMESARGVVFRPGLMYTDDEPATMMLGALMLGANRLTQRFKLDHLKDMATGALGLPKHALLPLPTTTVAKATLYAVDNESIQGIYLPNEIKTLAQQPPNAPL
eukprot:m.161516 g.161516  ORF g.161516 m.161516 type:complete len:256 (-) comp31240_c0_seq1:170-937(-)